MVAELCAITSGSQTDKAKLSIYTSNQSSGCNVPSPTPAPPSPTPGTSIGISHLKFINTNTNDEVASNCPKCLGNVAKLGLLGVVAEYWGGVESVQFKLTGKKSRTHTENASPFSLFGDGGSIYKINPGTWQKGSYTLECTGFTQRNRRGNASATKTVSFEIK